MVASYPTIFISQRTAGGAILRGGLAAGILDITAALMSYGLKGGSSARLLQSIAGGLFGADAYDGGFATAALGLALHFLIAFTAAAVFHITGRKIQYLVFHPVISGILYGIAVHGFMNLIVLPLSAFPHRIPYTITGLLTHVFCVGLPISLANSRYFSRRAHPNAASFSR